MAFPPRDRFDFAPYLWELAQRLCLKDWSIRVMEDGPDHHDAYASNNCIEGKKRAYIRLSEDFLRDSEKDQRHAAIHELIHCHTALLDHTIGKCCGGDTTAMHVTRLALEYAIEGLADAIAPLMPLPSDVLAKPKAPKSAKPVRKPRKRKKR